ncbi:MAG TPA: hypothetical protein VFN03_11175 [Trueperaceae bacterium]|nr:hypothetical protein [Trueperaceae bacterium]
MFKTGQDRATRTQTRSQMEAVEAERSRFSPAPLAGEEPLIGHVMDPDADERIMDEALIADEAFIEDEALMGDADDDASAHGGRAPALQPATLAEQRGMGIVRLVWDADGNVIETMGSWRPLEGAGETPPAGSSARFAGTLFVDGGRSVPIDTDVVISGGGTYTDVSGNEITLIRFDAPSLVGDGRFARR